MNDRYKIAICGSAGLDTFTAIHYLLDEIRALLPNVVCNVETNCGSIWFDDEDGNKYFISVGMCDEENYPDYEKIKLIEDEENELEENRIVKVDEDAIDQLSVLLNKPIDQMGGNIEGFMFDTDLYGNRTLVFGYANGSLGYDYLDNEENQVLDVGECKIGADAKEQYEYVKQILSNYGVLI